MTKEERFYEISHAITDPGCRALINDLFGVGTLDEGGYERVKMYKSKPAATKHHHNYEGGLLDHTLEVKRGMDVLLDSGSVNDKDLLYTGVMLHDFYKIVEYDYDGKRLLNYKGNKPPHIHLMDDYLKERGILYNELRELVGSHHGFTEWGCTQNALNENQMALFACDYYSSQGLESSAQELIDKMPNDWWTKKEKYIFEDFMFALEENKEYIFQDRNSWS